MRMSQPGSQGQASAVRWLQWLPLAGLAGILVLVALTPGAPSGMTLSYSQFLGDVGAGTVRAVTIGPVGQVTGRLVSGQPFTTTIPVALDDRSLPGQLTAHHVQVSAIADGAPGVRATSTRIPARPASGSHCSHRSHRPALAWPCGPG